MEVEADSLRPIRVTSEHPTYDFNIDDIVAVPGKGADPFWLATITSIKEEKLHLQFYDHNKPTGENSMIWRKHHSVEYTGRMDVLVSFRTDTQLFTKTGVIRKRALTKINAAYRLYQGDTLPSQFH